MKKDQYILAITGILDRESAALLLRELAGLLRTGVRRITLGGGALGPVLPEGVLALRAGVAELAETLDADGRGRPAGEPGVRIECEDLSDHACAQFLLNDVPVVERRAMLWPPTAVEAPDEASGEGDQIPVAAQLGADGWLVDCAQCRHSSRVRAPGDYACPVCGNGFRMLPDGAVVTV